MKANPERQGWQVAAPCSARTKVEFWVLTAFLPSSSLGPNCGSTSGCGTLSGLPRPLNSHELHRSHLNAVVGPRATWQPSSPAPQGPAWEMLLPHGIGRKGAGLSLSWGDQSPWPTAMNSLMGSSLHFSPPDLHNSSQGERCCSSSEEIPCALLSCLNTPTLNPQVKL